MSRLKGRFALSPMGVSICWMLLWALSHTTAMSFAKSLDSSIHESLLVFFRSSFALVFSLPFIVKLGPTFFKTKRPGLHLVRTLLVCCSMGCTYYAYRRLPLASASAIGFTGPIITTTLAIILLKDHVTWKKLAAILGGYLGVLIVVEPASLDVNQAFYVLIAANFLASLALITTKKLSATENPLLIITYTNIASLLISAAVTLFGAFSQFCYIRALKLGNPSFLSPFEYTRIVVAVPFGIFFFGEYPTLHVLVGAAVIISITYYLTRLEEQERRQG
ncbi:MAG: DMT family transporter [Alphaproteobacteria bacterium]|nr:DMT family transporter [Alphaproteobacteria bacterium]